MPKFKISPQRDAILLFLAITLFFCIGLGARPYLTPSEARYIEIPRQMLTTGDWLTPRINGVSYFEKPPLFYWMQATALSLFGLNEFAGRIATTLLASFTCLLTYATGRMLYGRATGLLAACVLATSLLGYGLSRVAMLDMPVSAFLTATFAAFLAAQPTQNRRYYWLMYVAAALAVMSKGLIGLVIPGIVIGAWIALTRQWHILKQAQLIPGLLIFLLIAAPWHILMAQHHPDFLQFYFIHEHFERFVSDEHKRTAPWWFFIAITVAGFIPWLGLLPAACKRLNPRNPITLFLLLWIALPLIFFSASHSKLVPYIFPIFPPLAIALGRTLEDIRQGRLGEKILHLNALLLIVPALLFAALASGIIHPYLPAKIAAKLAVIDTIPLASLLPLALMLLLLGLAILCKRRAATMIILLATFGATLGFTANYVTATIDTGSIKALAIPLKNRLGAEDTVVAYGSYWQDLPVYLDRNIIVAGWLGELSFGVEHYPQTHNWMISPETFWQRCATEQKPLYVFITKPAFQTLPATPGCPLHIIAEYGKTLLLEKTKD